MGYRIPKHDAKYLEVTVEGRKAPKRVPLMSSLPVPWIRRVNELTKLGDSAGMAWFDLACDLFGEYLGQDIIDQMTVDQVNDLFAAWSEENEAQGGASLGE